MIICGSKQKCEGPFQMIDIERASGIEIAQGTL